MKKIIYFFIILLLITSQGFANNSMVKMSYWAYPNSKPPQSGNDNRNLSYPISGSINNQGKTVQNYDLQEKLNLINLLAYAFLHVNKEGIVHFQDSYIDLEKRDVAFCNKNRQICMDSYHKYNPALGNFDAFSKLENNHKSLKKIISIGGAGDSNSFYYAINHVSNFVNSVATIIKNYNLNGVDLDFEINALFTPNQAKKLSGLVEQLRIKLGKSAIIILTTAPDMGTLQSIGMKNWEIIAKSASFVSIMGYEFHSAFYKPYYTGYNSNLYPDPNEPELHYYYPISCDQSIEYLTFLGVPSTKIILGFPVYGLSYGGVAPANNGLFQKFNPKLTPSFDNKGPGRVEYKTILKLLHAGFTEHASYFNGHISGVWAYNPNTKQFISFDNTRLVAEKANYIKSKKLAGAMCWLINYDAPATSKNSLLKALDKTV